MLEEKEKEKKKTPTAGFVPYRFVDGELFLFLQKRTNDAPHNPGNYAIFGGSLESGESREDALSREVKEELDLTINPDDCQLLGEYEEFVSNVSLYVLKVDEKFESSINFGEGVGEFISEHNIEEIENMTDIHRGIFLDVIEKIKSGD